MVRPADPLDGATPSGASSIAEALQLAAHLVPADRADRYAEAADATLASASPILARLPRSGGHWLAVAEAAVRGPIQIAVACDPARSELLAAARTMAPGGAVVVGGPVELRRTAARPRPGRRRRRRLCLPRPGVRPAGHDRRGISLPRWVSPCSVRRMSSLDRPRGPWPSRSSRPSTATSNLSATGRPTTSPSCTPTTRPSRIPSAERCTSVAQAIRGFYSSVENVKAQTEVLTLRALGSEAAFHWTLSIDFGDNGMRIDIISVMTFDDEGKIASMKAYWGPENVTQL